jgi:hypothetical protein
MTDLGAVHDRSRKELRVGHISKPTSLAFFEFSETPYI